MPRFQIGDLTFDTADGTLASVRGSTRLEPKLAAVLLSLVEQRGAVVSQEVLLIDVWRGTHVSSGALARAISLLRQRLGDDAHHPRYIETVPKRGYRLVATVVEVATPRAPAPSPAAAGRLSRSLRFAAVAATIAGLLIAPSSDWQQRETAPGDGRPNPQLTNQTHAGNENLLAHYTRTVARHPNAADAYAGLATAYAFRVNYLADGSHWAAVATDVATRAVALDADSASATRALATAHFQSRRLQEAARYYRRAISLGADDNATRTNLGRVLLWSGQVADALTLFESHMLSSPDSVTGYAHVAWGLAIAGYPREARFAARAAIAIEPYANIAPYNLDPQLVLVRLDLLTSSYASAQRRLERFLEVHPDCTQCVVQLGLIDQLNGDYASAEFRYQAARRMVPPFPAASLRLAHLFSLMGRADESAAVRGEVEASARAQLDGGEEGSLAQWQMSAIAAIAGDRRAALEWYARAIAMGRRDANWDNWEPMLSPLQAMPEFVALQHAWAVEQASAASIADRIHQRLSSLDPADAHDDPPGWP